MGAHSRRKGQRGELEAAAEIRRLFHVAARRGQQFCGADDSPDVLTELVGVHLEVKRTEALRLYAALEQAAADAGEQVRRRRGREPHGPGDAGPRRVRRDRRIRRRS